MGWPELAGGKYDKDGVVEFLLVVKMTYLYMTNGLLVVLILSKVNG